MFKNAYFNFKIYFPSWTQIFINYIPKPKYPEDRESIEGFVSLIASISGVLLALFYPVLATIASSGYAKVNSSIRNLLFLEPITQNYLRRLAFLTAYSVCTLLLIVFRIYPGNLIIILLGLLSLGSLFNLLKIGSGVYNLFDSSTLATIAIKSIFKSMRNITIESAYWNNSNFQSFFRRQVEQDLETLRLLNIVSIKGVAISEKSFISTVSQTLGLLKYYLQIKSRIPIESRWFKTNRVHQSYFETSMTNRQLSVSNRTYTVSNEVSNNYWLEEQIFDIYSEIGRKVCLLENQETRYRYLLESVQLLHYFGDSFEFDLANRLILENSAIAKTSLKNNVEDTYENSNTNLVLIESVISLSLRDYHLSFFNAVEFLTKNKFNGELKRIDWTNRSSLYKIKLPYQLNSFLEEYFTYIENEIFVEGKQITPIWYISQHITSEYLILVNNNFKKIIEQVSIIVLPLLENYKNNHLIVSFISQCTLEIIDKIKYRIPIITNILSEFDSNDIHKGSYKFTKIDSKTAFSQLDRLNDKFVLEIADNLMEIYSIKWKNNSPDIFARSFLIISQEINKSFLEKNFNKFQLLFPNFLKCCIYSFKTLYKGRFQGKYHHPFEIIYQFHIEVLQLSGLAFIYSELLELPYWEECINAWHKMELHKNEIELIISSYEYFTNVKAWLRNQFY